MTRARTFVAILVVASFARDPAPAAARAAGSTPRGDPSQQPGLPAGGDPLAVVTNKDELKNQARRHVWDTRYDEAEAVYRRVLARDPLDAEAGAGLARVLTRENRLHDAEELVREVLDRQPETFEARLVLAELLLRTERPTEALAEFDRATSIEPMDPRSAQGRSRALSACDREVEARAADEATATSLAARLTAHPEDLELRLALASALFRLGRLEEALAEYEDALRRDPRDREAGLSCARAMLRLDRPEEARARVERLLVDHPQSAEAHGLRGAVQLRLGLPAEGEPSFARAVELDRWNPDYRLGIARCRWAQADLAGARASCAEALALDARNREVQELLARIDSTPAPGDFRLWTGFRFDHLSGDRDDWTQETVHLGWRAREDLVLGMGADAYHRFGEDDVQVAADCAWRISEPWTWSTTLVYGPDVEVVARGVIDTEIARRMGPSTTAFLRWRHSSFPDDIRVDLFSPGVEFTCGSDCSLTARYFLVDESETGRGDGGSLRLAIAPEGRVGASLGVSYGTETFLTNTPNPATRDSDVLTLAAGLKWRATERVHLRLDYDYENHESAYEKHGLALGLALDL